MNQATTQARPAEPSSLRLALTLGFAGLFSGLALVTVYEWTKPIIEANKAAALQRAVFKVVPGSRTVKKWVQDETDGWQLADPSDKREGIYAAHAEDGRLLGYAIASAGAGFQDTIRLIFGFDPSRQLITGMEVLESRETPGLGDKIYKDKDFVANFADLAIKPEVVLVKKGRTKPNEVDAITGATISSRAVVKIVNQATNRWISGLPKDSD